MDSELKYNETILTDIWQSCHAPDYIILDLVKQTSLRFN